MYYPGNSGNLFPNANFRTINDCMLIPITVLSTQITDLGEIVGKLVCDFVVLYYKKIAKEWTRL